MTEEEIKGLAGLDPAMFDGRELAALRWVRETLTRREGASTAASEEFERYFDERQRRYIVAAMKSMYFFNLAGNTMDAWLGRMLGRREEQPAACALNWEQA